MARMKGNRGTNGFQLPPVDLPVVFGDDRPPGGGRIRWWAVITAALVVAVIAAGAIAFALRNNDGVATAEPTEPATPAASSAVPTPTATTAVPAAVSVSATPPRTTPPSPTLTATATPPSSPVPAATPTPSGPPLVRARYVVQPGDACEVIRMKFRFANADFEDFQVAVGALSGRPASTRCVMRTGDVLCIPTQSDLGHLNALTKDEACLVGP